MYADNLFGMTLMKRLTKEGNNIICADKTLAEINNKIERVRVNKAADRDNYGSKIVQVKH